MSFSQKARLRALRALRALAGGHVLWERNGGWLQKRKNDKQMGIRAKLVDLVACDLLRTVLVLCPHRLSGQHGNLILQGSASIL